MTIEAVHTKSGRQCGKKRKEKGEKSGISPKHTKQIRLGGNTMARDRSALPQNFK
jgi:hypothetical protein